MSSKYIIEYPTLKRILLLAVGPRVKTLKEWKLKLQFLHVCRLWTDILTPVVFREIIIHAVTSRRRLGLFKSRKYKLVINSNLLTIIAREAHNYADSLLVSIPSHIVYFLAVFQISKIISQYQLDFPNVNSFSFYSRYEKIIYRYKFLNGEVAYDKNLIETAEGIFHSRFPNIQHLSVNNREFLKEKFNLFEYYFTNLTFLNYRVNLALSDIHYFKSDLAYLYLDLGSTKLDIDRLPSINPLPLKFLVLKKISLTVFHKLISNNGDMRCIRFPSLELLGLEFLYVSDESVIYKHADVIENNSSDFKLQFPSIKYLFLDDCNSNYFIDNLLAYCKDMEIVYIKGFFNTINRAKGLALNSTKKLTIYLKSFQNDFTNDFSKISDVFRSVNADIQLYFEINDYLDNSLVPLDDMRWPHLNQLFFRDHLSIKQMLYFICKIPSLHTFWVRNLENYDFKHYLENIDIRDIKQLTNTFAKCLFDSGINLQPKNLNLKNLHLSSLSYFPKVHVALIGFITKLVPSIESYNIDYDKYNNAYKNMSRYRKVYPHLQNITFGYFNASLPYHNISTIEIDDGFIGFSDF